MRLESDVGRLQRADLLSTTGAGVLGGGLALLFANALAPYASAILVVGVSMHAWGMYQKHRIETQDAAIPPWWTEALYWLCWLVLAGLVLVIALALE